MHAWEAIQLAIDYIEEHLKDKIDTVTLAETVGLSPFYFQRLFARLVNKPVQEYIKLRRLAKAAQDLKLTKKRILDIALEYVFSNHANFTRAFKDAYGITPEEYRKVLPPLNTVIKPEIAMQYVMIDEGVPLIVGDIVLEINRKTLKQKEFYLGFKTKVSISAQTPVGENTGIDVPGQLWACYHNEKEFIEKYLVSEIELGMSDASNPQKGTFSYFVGGLAKSIPENLCNSFVQHELPEGEYIICSIEAESFETLVSVALDQASKYLFGTWLPYHHLSIQPFSAEKYYPTLENIYRMEIWIMPLSV